MQRPTGVTILAVLEFIGAAGLVLGGMLLIAAGGIAGARLSGTNPGTGGAAFFAGLGAVGAVFCFVFAAINGLMGWGLWTLKGWARLIVMIFAIIGALFAALGLIGRLFHMQMYFVTLNLVQVAINGFIAWYLNQPHVKAAFGA